MMGVITEDRKDMLIKNMIGNIGIKDTFNMVGDYDLVNSYLTDEDKIIYIKDEFTKINDGKYFTLEQIWEQPIQLKSEDDENHQIEGLHKDHVMVNKHSYRGGYISRRYHLKYEELSSETIDKLFRMMLGQYIKI
jgi:hypothetical protein